MPLPERLGRLERHERLGVGGFATVWRYRDVELESDVAVKALAENWAQRLDVRERFLEEARILRRADSDHVVHVYDVGEADETPYFVMSYADLGSLAGLLAAEPVLPPAQVADLVTQAGAGLTVLHEHGVVHRDIKPQNLLLRSNGGHQPRVLVADLGVAKALLHASGLTQVVGTPAYMAPEQATGGSVDVRSDVHALAAVAYQMLTGCLAREGSIADLALAQPPAPPSRWADLPPAADAVLLAALDPDPDARPADVEAFVRLLRAALAPAEQGHDADEAHRTRAQTRAQTRAEAPTARQTVQLTAAGAGPGAARDHAERRPSRWLLVAALCLVVFAATFAASYAVTAALA